MAMRTAPWKSELKGGPSRFCDRRVSLGICIGQGETFNYSAAGSIFGVFNESQKFNVVT